MSEETQTSDKRGGWMVWISQQPLPVRGMIFTGFMFLVIFGVCGGTALLYYLNVQNYPRLESFAVADNVTVSELATFPVENEDVFPSAIAVASDGTAYTGSYTTGTLWSMTPDGTLTEIAGSNDLAGSIVGLDVAADGTLYALDRRDPFRPQGAIIWQVRDGVLSELVTLDEDTILQPNDIVVDDAGRVYVVDLAGDQILQIDEDGVRIWWQPRDTEVAPAGLAIDSANEQMLVTDAQRHAVYGISLNPSFQPDERESTREVLYSNPASETPPGFNGITVTTDGTIYVAALVQNEIVRIVPDSELTVIAGQFRGGSDVAYDAANDRLLVNNWDQSWLVPITFVVISFDVPPRVPFSIDAIDL